MSSQPAAGAIRSEVSGAIATLTIDNPQRHNAVSRAMWLAIPEAVARLEADEDVRVIVLRGAGEGAFVSGADISEFDVVRRNATSSREYEQANGSAFSALRQCQKPTIAMIRKFCMGGGVGLAAACDLRMAADDSVFAIPPAKLGLGYPPEAMKDVLDLIGPANARDLYFTARRLDAAEALRIGLVNRVVSVATLESETATLAATIAANAPLTIRAVKAAIFGHQNPGKADWKAIYALADACFESEDYVEGRAAFREKRPAVFKGR